MSEHWKGVFPADGKLETTQKKVEQHACTKCVALCSSSKSIVVGVSFNDLRCHIPWGTTSLVQIVCDVLVGRQAKIANLEVSSFHIFAFFFSQHDILWLQVSVENSFVLQIL